MLLLGAVFFLSRGTTPPNPQAIKSANVVQIDYSKGQKIGSDSAKVKLVEFSDFQCPACLDVEPYLEKLRNTYADKMQFIYKEFPLTQHAHSRKAAYLAEAAGEQGKFWDMHDKLFQTQAQWVSLNDDDATAFFLNLAKQMGLDENKVKQEIQGDTFKTLIDNSIAEGNAAGLDATPTFFLNGHKLNLQTFDDLITVVSQEINKSTP